MKRSTGIAAVILLFGCSTAPVSFFGVAPPGKDSAYECAVAQLNIMGYNIEDGNKDAGFVRGRKQTSGLGTQIFTGNAYHDVLTATVFDNPATGDTNLRVVAARIADQDIGLLGALLDDEAQKGEEAVAPSDSGIADAQRLLTGCGVTSVIGPPGQEEYALEGVAAASLTGGEGGSAGNR